MHENPYTSNVKSQIRPPLSQRAYLELGLVTYVFFGFVVVWTCQAYKYKLGSKMTLF